MHKKRVVFAVLIIPVLLAVTGCDFGSLFRHEFSLGLSADGSGSGEIAEDSTENGTYGGGFLVTAAALVAAGSEFTGWYDAESGGSLVSSANPYTFELSAKTSLYARFDLEAPKGTTPGMVSLFPAEVEVKLGEQVTTDIFVNTGDQLLASYDLTLNYDESVLACAGDVVDPDNLFLLTQNRDVPGEIGLAGMSINGVGPGASLRILTVTWDTRKEGNSDLSLTVKAFINPAYLTIGTPNGIGAKITVTAN